MNKDLVKEKIITGGIYILALCPSLFSMFFSHTINVNYLTLLMVMFFPYCILRKNTNTCEYEFEEITWIRLFFAFLIDIFFFFIIMNVLAKTYESGPLFSSPKLTVYFGFWLLMINQVFFRSPGFFILNLYIPNKTSKEKIKILFMNFIVHSFFYSLILRIQFPKIQSSLDYFLILYLLLFFINTFSRIFYFKTYSLLEKKLNIQILKGHKVINK